MLPDAIRSLILDEHARAPQHFLDGVDVDAYLAKLADRAEVLCDWGEGRCRGLVAFYCNDESTRQAFITLVLVDPRDRRLGIGRALIACVLDLARRRGYTSCRLEVARHNDSAHDLYASLGFRVVERRSRTELLEVGL
jgi:ribosomal protein S18 acetylase RimI-like enzyme